MIKMKFHNYLTKRHIRCEDHEQHIWKKGEHFPILICKNCGQRGRIVII